MAVEYIRGMIAQDGTVLSPNGWTLKDSATGAIEYIDDSWNPVAPESVVAAPPVQDVATYNTISPGTAEAAPAMPAPPPLPVSEVAPQPIPDAMYSTPTMPSMSSFGGGSSYGGQASPRPSFANGVQHPLWSGQPLTPGGQWNDGQSAPRQNVYNPDTGAWAGNGAGAPRAARGGAMTGAYGSSNGGGSSGGGGGGSALYQAWRDKLTAKLYPGSGSGYSGSSSSGGYGSSYPPEEKMKGPWAKKVDPSQAATLSYRPSMLIPKVAPGLSSTSPLYQQMAAEPAAQLGMIMDGTKKVKQPVYPSTSYAADGTMRTKKGQSGNIGSTTVNSIGNYYDRAINKETTPTYGELIHNLDSAGKKSLIGTQLGGPSNPLGIAATNASNLYSAAFSQLDSPVAANAYQTEVEGLIDQYGSKFLKKPVGKAPAMNRWIGKRTSF